MGIITRVLLTGFALCVLVNMVFFRTTTYAASFVFTRTLKVGISGEDVRELQKILNSDASTRIRETGLGSPGKETTYFGTFTNVAVVHFQEKYKNKILVPNGLSVGTGVVGQSTRTVLEKIRESLIYSATIVSRADTMVKTEIPLTFSTSTSNIVVQENPNKKNLDQFLAAIDSVGQKKGVSVDMLARIKQQVTIDVGTSTNLQKKFIEMVQNSITMAPQPVQSVLLDVIKPFKEMFFPKKAIAATGVSFGGAVILPFFCTCSANWLIGITPLSPTFVKLLSYEPGSQIFLSQNIPFTNWLLGQYTPGAGICEVYAGLSCITVPSEGLITPFVGSSPI